MRPTSCRIIGEVKAAGHTSLTAIAGQLTARKVATANGGRWTVRRYPIPTLPQLPFLSWRSVTRMASDASQKSAGRRHLSLWRR